MEIRDGMIEKNLMQSNYISFSFKFIDFKNRIKNKFTVQKKKNA